MQNNYVQYFVSRDVYISLNKLDINVKFTKKSRESNVTNFTKTNLKYFYTLLRI